MASSSDEWDGFSSSADEWAGFSPPSDDDAQNDLSFDDIPPPTETVYPDLEAGKLALKANAKANGFGLTQMKTVLDKRTPPTTRRLDFRCAKGGVKRGEGVTRKTGTRMVECPFEARLKRMPSGAWQVNVVEASHNHNASHPSAFSQFRQPNKEEQALIRSLHASGSAPRYILTALLERDPNCLISLRDIYNEAARVKRERLGPLSPIEALVTELEEDEWASFYSTDNVGHVNILFFALHESIELAQAHPDVIFIDATYRTNRYNMPAIHFMAVTPIGKTLSIAICLLRPNPKTCVNSRLRSLESSLSVTFTSRSSLQMMRWH
jgi:hypothetical protein